MVLFGALSVFLPDANSSGFSHKILIFPGEIIASLSILIRIPCPEKTATVGLSAG